MNGSGDERRTRIKRVGTSTPSEPQTRKTLMHHDYTVAWICPLEVELIAALEMLDEEHERLSQSRTDHNVYHLGSVFGHNVVIAGLWNAGNSIAATVVAQLRMTFPNIQYGLLVGIGGGVPVVTDDGMIRLGHVVVSKPVGLYSGAIQYDRGKAEAGAFVRTGALAPPPPVLLLAAQALGAQRARLREDPLMENIHRIDISLPGLSRYRFPGVEQDYLFPSSYSHQRRGLSCKEGGCDPAHRILRCAEDTYQSITVHRGTIASGELVLKDGIKRDLLSQEYGVLCFEMEAAGALSDFPCLVVRGISDYCDSHKNDQWHGFAAAAAAAYARQLFFHIPMEQDNRPVSSDDPGVRRMIERSDEHERQKIADWLSPTNYTTFQAHFLKQREAGTGEWLLETPEFRTWVQRKGVLFCPGIPGAGKTILSSVVINHLQESHAVDQNVGIAYIFFNYRQQGEQQLEGILGTILKQLIQATGFIPDMITKLYERHGSRPERSDLLEALVGVAELCSHVYLVVDALDECSESGGRRDAIISELLNFCQRCNVSLLATSRIVPEITARFEMFPSVEVRASDADVRRYAEGQLQQFSNCVRRNAELSELVVWEIVRSVSGMFLLAKLYLDSLKGKSSAKAVKTALGKLQTGSDAYDFAYQEAMKRIEHQIADQALLAKRTLSWLACAERSLTLTELRHALAVELNESAFDEENLPDIEDMISVCAGLVTYYENNHVITLVHCTTQEYFEREWTTWFPNAHREIGQTCVTYLSYDVFSTGPCKSFREYHARLRDYPLYNYAACNWGHHARRQRLDEQLVLNLLEHDQKLTACAQAKDGWNVLRRIPSTTALHMTTGFGLEVEADTLLANGHEVDCYDEEGRTPLWVAIRSGDEAIVWLLARHNPTRLVEYEPDTTILHLAVEGGHESLVKSFLEVDSDRRRYDRDVLNSRRKGVERAHNTAKVSLFDIQANLDRTDQGMTPLALAAERGHHGIVKLLLQKGARTDSAVTQQNAIDQGASPLSIAARNGHEEVVRLILEHDPRPDGPDCSGRTPLSHAAAEGHLQVMQLLIAAGARTDLVDGYGGTPLFYGVEKHQVAAVNLLLQNGADPNIHGNHCCPLVRAVASGMTDMVDLLLTHGANPNMHDRDIGKIWSRGIQRAGKETWRLLVNHIAHDAPNGVHDDMLLWAARHGYISLVEVLLEHSANINIGDPHSGGSPVSLAVLKGHYQVPAVSVDKGANPEVQDSIGRTPLSRAAMAGAEDIVRLLLERGANPRSRDNVGQTPLFYAIENGNEAIIRALLEKDPTLCHCRDEFGRGPLLLATDETRRALLQIIGDIFRHSEDHSSGLDIVTKTIGLARCELPQSKGQRLFLWAAAKGHLDLIKALMEKDISPLCHDDSGKTPFTLAVQNRQVDVIKHFLHCGLDPNSEDEAGYTPLSWAVYSGDEATIQLLLESGADHNTPIKEVSTKGHRARPRLLFFLAVERGYDRVVDLLLQLGVDANYHPRESGRESICERYSALALAVMKGHFSVADILLHGNIDNPQCHDALRLAMELTDTPLACLIMQKGIRTNWLLEGYGEQLLFQAAFSGCVPVLKGLLTAGMKPDLSAKAGHQPIVRRTKTRCNPYLYEKQAYAGDTPLTFAAHEGHLEVVQVLLDNNAGPNAGSPLLGAILNGHVRVAELLLLRGAQLPNENYGAPLLHLTVARGLLDAVRMLLDIGLDPATELNLDSIEEMEELDLNSINQMEQIDPEMTYVGRGHLLLKAVARRDLDIVQLLLTRGVDPNVTDNFGQTALFVAAEQGNCTMLQRLLELGCSANATDRVGRTPLFVAAYYCRPKAVKILLNVGADTQAATRAGRTPISVARDLNYPEVVSLLGDQSCKHPSYEERLSSRIVDLEPYCGIVDLEPYCGICYNWIAFTDYPVKCSICKNCYDRDVFLCLECVASGLACYDPFHTLHKMAYDKDKRTWVAVEKISRWRHGSSPVRAPASRPP